MIATRKKFLQFMVRAFISSPDLGADFLTARKLSCC